MNQAPATRIRQPLRTRTAGLWRATKRYLVRLPSRLRAIKNAILAPPAFVAPATRPPTQNDKPDIVIWGVIEWSLRHQRPQQLAHAWAAAGHRVFYVSRHFVEDTRPGFSAQALDASQRLFEIKLFAHGHPVIYAGAPQPALITQLRRGLGELLLWADSGRALAIVHHPFWLDIATTLPNSQMIYDCMDHHAGFANTAPAILALEERLIRTAELTITTSARLAETIIPNARAHALVRNGCDFEHFAPAATRTAAARQGLGTVGYFGAIADWFDVSLVAAVAKALPEARIELIGADTAGVGAQLASYANVTLLGERPYAELPSHLARFDVCLLPFRVNDLTKATNPVKVYEYLSAGKPVVSVALPELAHFDDLVATAATPDGFVTAVATALRGPATTEHIAARQAFARQHTWAARVREFDAAVAQIHQSRVSVIVLTYNNLDLTKACLASIDAHSDYDNLELIIVDNASTDGTPEFLREYCAARPDVVVHFNASNLGFAAGNNVGLTLATGDYLVMLNNDTVVTPGWLRTLVRHLKRDPGLGLLGPVTNNIGNEAKVNVVYADVADLAPAARAYTLRHLGELTPLTTAAFFCVMLPRAVYDAVGGLDEVFGRGFFEDDDYCRRVQARGLRIACADDVFVHHHLSASFNKLNADERARLFDDNRREYEKKWGKWVPHRARPPT